MERLVSQGHNVVITGQAGVGKTTLLKQLGRNLRNSGRKVVYTAATGIASLHFAGGVTLHSWCGIQV